MDAQEFISEWGALTAGIWAAHLFVHLLRTTAEAKPQCFVGNTEFHGKPQWLKSVCSSWK